jgi:hypothetical protein
MENRIWYSLNIADIQDVAMANLGRSLDEQEIEQVINVAEQHLPWAETILNAIEANGIR